MKKIFLSFFFLLVVTSLSSQDTTKYWTDPNPSFPNGNIINAADFPITLDVDFTDPILTYPAPYTYFTDDATLLSDYANAIATDPNATISVNIPYLNQSYDCKILNKDQLELKIFESYDQTFFLDEGIFPISAEDIKFIRKGLRVVGATAQESVIYSTKDNFQWYVYNEGKNFLFENLVFDGNNKKLQRYYFHFEKGIKGNENSDNFIMKNVKFRNIGNTSSSSPWWAQWGSKDLSVLDFVDREYRNENNHRYFINVTIESANLTSKGAIININSCDGVYFRNLDIQTSTGHPACIHISNRMIYPENTYPGFNYGDRNIIFAGTLNTPIKKSILIKSYDSRNISLPFTHRFAGLYHNWNKMDMYHYAMTITNEETFLAQGTNPALDYITPYPNSATYLVNDLSYLDLSDGAYIIRNGHSDFDRTKQLNTIKALQEASEPNFYSNIPNPIIKMIDNPTGIGGFSVPNLENGKTIHLIALNNISDTLQQDPMSVMYDGNTISINEQYVDKVHIYNVDFSDYFKISDALAPANGVENSIRSVFYHDRFRNDEVSLPIDLYSFKAQAKSNHSVLKWKTLSETNNDYFVLYHSIDAQNWKEIARIKGAGNCVTPQNYNYTHTNPESGNNYYLLQQVDYNGEKNNLGIRSVAISFFNMDKLQIYPNPLKDILTIKANSIVNKVEVYSLNHTLLYKNQFYNKEVKIDFNSWNSGIYIVRVIIGKKVKSFKIIKE